MSLDCFQEKNFQKIPIFGGKKGDVPWFSPPLRSPFPCSPNRLPYTDQGLYRLHGLHVPFSDLAMQPRAEEPLGRGVAARHPDDAHHRAAVLARGGTWVPQR